MLDLGSADGGTLRHFAELRADLVLSASDLARSPDAYASYNRFSRADFDSDSRPWPDASFEPVTCVHVVEHLNTPDHLIQEAVRVLKPGGRIYVETPHPKSLHMKSPQGRGTEHVTVNFFDDKTHMRIVAPKELLEANRAVSIVKSEQSRNLVIAAAFPLLFVFRNCTRGRYVAQLHWTGWSAFAIAVKA